MKYVVIVLCFVVKCHVGQVLQFGSCPVVETVTLFDVERFLGTWHVIERFPAWFEDKGDCAYKVIQACGGRRIELQHVFVRDDIEYYLHVNSTYKSGDEAVFSIEANNIDPIGIPLSVIATDYDSYAIVYGCKLNVVLNIRYTTAWILSRNLTLPPEVLQEARTTLTAVPSTSPSFLEHVQQDKELCTFHWTAHIYSVNSTHDAFE